MQHLGPQLLLSATDLVNFHECGHLTALDLRLDRLLREKRLVDLYRVTRVSIRASTSSYSIKDIEAFYRGKRSGDVQFARRELSFVRAYLPQLPRVVDTGAMV